MADVVQVETLLLSDPGNEELREMYDSLSEVIQLTVDLLKDAGAAEAAAAAPAAQPAAAGRLYVVLDCAERVVLLGNAASMCLELCLL
jgi:hypothetical protein